MEPGLGVLAPERMMENAYERLYESINTGRLIGFVGSGLSLVYGNLTWLQFIEQMFERLEQELGRPPHCDQPSEELIRAEMEAVRCRPEEESTIVLEFIRQSFGVLDAAVGKKDDETFQKILSEMFESDRSFVAKALAHRLELAGVKEFADWTEGEGKGNRRSLLLEPAHKGPKFMVDKAKADSERRLGYSDATVADLLYDNAGAIYDIGILHKLAAGCKVELPELADLDKVLQDEILPHQRGTRLPTDRRGVLSIFLAGSVLAKGHLDLDALMKDDDRDGLVPARPMLDPLRSLYDNLGIRRYFTTNYDFEIENLFMFADIRESLRDPLSAQDRRTLFQRPDFHTELEGASLTRRRPDGIRIKSDVNDGRHTAPLVEFGLGSTDNTIHIYHHHGRADLPKTLIAADGEYNNMYRAEGLNRQSLDRAYDAMIEGNPILFVGSGLGEQELTRTLRHRVSNKRSPNDTPIFVLRAADRIPKELMREQLTLASKLDVQVLHFGHPRRGRGFSLRKHTILLDMIAERVIGADPKAWSRHIDPKGSSDPDYVRKEQATVQVLVDRFAAQSHTEIVRALGEEFGLIADLDFDRHVVAWLLGSGGTTIAKRVEEIVPPRAAARTEDQEKKHEGEPEALLIADYLRTLGSRLWTAALRHELRQIGKEAKDFYNRKSRPLQSRTAGRFGTKGNGKVPNGWHRHLYIDIDPAEDSNFIPWSETLLWPATTPSDKTPDIRFGGSRIWAVMGRKHPSPEPEVADNKPEREIIIGDRGSGKGGMLKKYFQGLKRDLKPGAEKKGPKRWLLVNCSYGQEADSAITLIADFLDEKSGTPAALQTRRERILAALERLPAATSGERPLLVLGAVDRLFGLDHEPSGAEFEWLLRKLIQGSENLDVMVTGSQACERYFLKLAKQREDLASAQQSQLLIWRVSPKFPQNADLTDRWLGMGYLKSLRNNNNREDSNLSRADVAGARTRMRHDWRRIEDIVGQSLDLLHNKPLILTSTIVTDDGPRKIETPISVGSLGQEMLRVLAFVGLPIEGEILLTAPGVRRELDRLIGPDDAKCGGDRVRSASKVLGGSFDVAAGPAQELFLGTLTRLMEKHLVSVIEPHGSEGPPRCATARDAISKGCRFALHRVVSQIIRGRFGVPNNETVLSSSFNLSLYAAQPSDAPAFAPEIMSDVEQLLDHLLNAWHDVTLNPQLEETIEAARKQLLQPENYASSALAPDLLLRLSRYEHNVRMLDPLVPRALRAAGGLIRGFFSSVNLLSLDLENPVSRTQGRSVISVQKQRIRTLLDQAIESQRVRTSYDQPSPRQIEKWKVERGAELFKKKLAAHFRVRVLVSDPDTDGNGGKRVSYKRTMLPADRTPFFPEERFRLDPYSSVGLEDFGEALKALSEGPREHHSAPLHLLYGDGNRPLLYRLDHRLADKRPSASGMQGALREPEVLKTFAFYEEEVVWLLNERAMLSLAQGDLYTASTAFELAFEANSRIEGNRYHPRRCRLLLNRSLLWIERGKIVEARRSLSDLREGLDGAPDSIEHKTREGKLIHAVATGYLGLCDQLNGYQTRADQKYRAALHELNGMEEHRAIAIFEYHRGSLLQNAVGQRDAAAACFDRAISAAEGGRHTDILYRVRVAQAHNDRVRKQIDPSASRAILQRAINYGERLDMPRVRVEALSASAQLRLELGDIEAAAYDCSRALALSAQFGMTLRRVWLRMMSGKVYLARNDLPNARYMFEQAIGAAERIGFQRAIEDANRNLMLMPVRPGDK